MLASLGPGPLGTTVVRTAAGAAITVVPATASPLIGHLDPVVTDDRSIRIGGWALDWRLNGPGTVIGVFADGRFIDEVAPWIERPDVADVLALDPARSRSGAGRGSRSRTASQPEWLCTGFFIDLPVAVAPWLADAHIQVIQVSRELGLATEVEYGPGLSLRPAPRRDRRRRRHPPRRPLITLNDSGVVRRASRVILRVSRRSSSGG